MKLWPFRPHVAIALALAAVLLLVGYGVGTWHAQVVSGGESPSLQRGLAPLTPRSRIVLPGVLGRIDHFGWDGKRGNLFVAALGNNTVEVINNLRPIHTKPAAASSPQHCSQESYGSSTAIPGKS